MCCASWTNQKLGFHVDPDSGAAFALVHASELPLKSEMDKVSLRGSRHCAVVQLQILEEVALSTMQTFTI